MNVRAFVLAAALAATGVAAEPALEEGFREPPPAARPHTYWLWLNGHVDLPTAADELKAMKDVGFGGVLIFEMGARGDPATIPTPGPAFLSAAWVKQLRTTADQAKALGLQVDMSVISSWDMGGPWIEPRYASKALYASEATIEGGRAVDELLPFPQAEKAAPRAADGRPVFWSDVAVLAVRAPHRLPGHEFVLGLDPAGSHALREVALDNGQPNAPADLAATMTPVREFSVAVSDTGTRDADFAEVVRGTLPAAAGRTHFPLVAGIRARYVRLRLLSGHDATRPRWTLGEFEVMDADGRNVSNGHPVDPHRAGALVVRAPVPLTYGAWSVAKLHDARREGPNGVFATAGLPSFDFASTDDIIDVTDKVGRDGRLRWAAPGGLWTILRYVCMITGEKLKVPSPASDGLASDHLDAEATRLHMNHVIAQLRAGFGDLRASGLTNLYLASYEVVGKVWSPVFAAEFKRRRGYALTKFLPAIFGARIGDESATERFLFDYQKTLGEVVVEAYYRTAAEIAHAAGLKIKSEAGGPGPPIVTPPVDALLADGSMDSIQGEFWPAYPDNKALWVVKEPATAAHIYGHTIANLEAFTSHQHWAEGPQDLKPAADRVFTEGGNHFVWHTWTHQAPGFGLPGLVYGAGTHLNRSVTWWPKAKPFIDYLSRGSFLLQRGLFVADVLYYYGDGGGNFVQARQNPPTLGPGYDYDVTNADVILHRLSVRDGRLVLPEGTSYSMLVLPDRDDINPVVLAKIETLVKAGATVLGRRPRRASGLEGFPASDAQVREIAGRLWGDLDGTKKTKRRCGAGQIFEGVTERQALAALHVAPDFTASASYDFTHRRDGATDIYFVRNRTKTAVTENITFRVADRVPEFWDLRTGAIAPAVVYRRMEQGTAISLTLPPSGATFVVFRHTPATESIESVSGGAHLAVEAGVTRLIAESNGTFEVRRSTGWSEPITIRDLPAPMTLDDAWTLELAATKLPLSRVGAWTEQTAPEMRYFSGSASYRKTFEVPANWLGRTQRVELDLGDLWCVGEAWLNGQSLGVLWTAPYRGDCTGLVREGKNELVVEVINTWHNRLVGEARGAVPRITRTNITSSQQRPWKDLEPNKSGLFGPVRLVPIAIREVGSGTTRP